MDAQAGRSSGGTTDGETEESEDPSSSSVSTEVLAAQGALESLAIKDDSGNKEEDDADPLSAFRQQWQRELESSQTPKQQSPARQLEKKVELEPEDDDERAKHLFLRGCELERRGLLYEAVQHYKRAVALRPDIERRLYDAGETYTPEVETPVEPDIPRATPVDGDDYDPEKDGDLHTRIQRIFEKKGVLCEPNLPQKGAHISWLPNELVVYLLRWVVSRDLDAAALERVGMASRGLYLAARQPELWRALCVRTWGLECGTPKTHGFQSWRDMYIQRPRLRLHGCYISKASYLRAGENSFQDYFYRPWYLIDYYRYFRFFSDGQALMWTTAEEPAQCVQQLRHRTPRTHHQGIMAGHYRLVGDKLAVVLKKLSNEKNVVSTTRFRARRKDAAESQDHVFHAELQLKSVKSRRNWQLVWRRYAVKNRFDQWSSFELTANKYPPLAFSAVRTYMSEADAPLL